MTSITQRSDAFERQVLAQMMLSQQAYDDIISVVDSACFSNVSNGQLFSVISNVRESIGVADPVTVMDACREHGIEMSSATLAGIISEACTPVDAKANATKVREFARLRSVAQVLESHLQLASKPSAKSSAVIESVELQLDGVTQIGETSVLKGLHEHAQELLDSLEETSNRGGKIGQPTGLESIDREYGGLFPKELIVLAARPGSGKTALALQLSRRVAEGDTVLFVSYEMSGSELVNRIACATSQISGTILRNGTATPSQVELHRKAVEETKGLNIQVLDDPDTSLSTVKARARQLAASGGLSMIVVDYIQLIPVSNARAQRHEQIGEITRGLKAIAKQLGVPVLALAQLNRGVEKDKGVRPKLSHLRESGSIEQDADVVMFIHHDQEAGESFLITEKNRNGPTGQQQVKFDRGTTTFRDIGIEDAANNDFMAALDGVDEWEYSP